MRRMGFGRSPESWRRSYHAGRGAVSRRAVWRSGGAGEGCEIYADSSSTGGEVVADARRGFQSRALRGVGRPSRLHETLTRGPTASCKLLELGESLRIGASDPSIPDLRS